MARYLMFTFPNYYPMGGMNDFQGAFDTVLACMKHYTEHNANILDLRTMQTIQVPKNLNGDQLMTWARDQDKLLRK